MRPIIEKIRQKAKQKLQTIVLPESNDRRVIEAAQIIQKENLAKVILLTPDKINPQDKEKFAEEFYQLRKAKGVDLQTAYQILDQPLYYAAMMVRMNQADGFVAGAVHTTPQVIRAAIHCLGVDKTKVVFSCFIIDVPDCSYGQEGVFVFGDCGVVPEPSALQLAYFAVGIAEFVQKVLEFQPRIAFLSYSTKGSADGKQIEKIRQALEITKQLKPDLLVDGELQADAAIVPEVAEIKESFSPVAGKANVLIFPNLEAGNISYKLVQRLAKARAIGPILLGLNYPCSDLSRGCSVDDIIDAVAITAIRAQQKC